MQSFFNYFFFFFSYFLFPSPFLFILPPFTNPVITKKLKSFIASWVESKKSSKNSKNWSKISVFSSKMPKNWSRIHLNDQKNARIPKYFIKMIKKAKKSIRFSFFWSKMPKTWSKFHQNDQKTDRIQKYLPKMIKNPKIWILVWCFASILQIFLFQKKARFIHLALDLWHYVINPFFHTSSDEEQGEANSLKIKF